MTTPDKRRKQREQRSQKQKSRARQNMFLVAWLLVIVFAGTALIWVATARFGGSGGSIVRNSERSAMLAGDYLVNATNESGRFIYDYDPLKDVEKNGYNILRHAGTLYAMSELYSAYPSNELRDAMDKALAYLIQQTHNCHTDQSYQLIYACVVEDNEVKLGGNALAVLALIEYSNATETNDHAEAIERLSGWMIATQEDSGEFYLHKALIPGMLNGDFVSEYYPGEAIYALSRASVFLNTPEYLDAAERGAMWLTDVRDLGVIVEDLIHDHWLLYGLRELYQATENPTYQEQSKRYASAIIQGQRTTVTGDQPEFWIGSFYTPPRSTPTATRMEGLIAAYNTSNPSDRKYRSELRHAIRLGMKFLLTRQITRDVAQTLPDPDQAIGGVISGSDDQDIRIDYVQHALSAFLGVQDIL
jgi:hypothetical protein